MFLKDEEVSMHINSDGLIVLRGKLESDCKFLYFLAPKIDESDGESPYKDEVKIVSENKELFKQQRNQKYFKEHSPKNRKTVPTVVQQPIQQPIQQPPQLKLIKK